MRIKILDERPITRTEQHPLETRVAELEQIVAELEERVGNLALDVAKKLTAEQREVIYWQELVIRLTMGLPPEANRDQVSLALDKAKEDRVKSANELMLKILNSYAKTKDL